MSCTKNAATLFPGDQTRGSKICSLTHCLIDCPSHSRPVTQHKGLKWNRRWEEEEDEEEGETRIGGGHTACTHKTETQARMQDAYTHTLLVQADRDIKRRRVKNAKCKSGGEEREGEKTKEETAAEKEEEERKQTFGMRMIASTTRLPIRWEQELHSKARFFSQSSWDRMIFPSLSL